MPSRCPFQIKINCSKFIIDGLHQRCYVTFLVSLFVTSRTLLFGVFLPKKIVTVLRRIAVNFTKMWLKCVFLSVSIWNVSTKLFKSTCEIVESLKNFCHAWTSSEAIFKVSSRIFFTYWPIHLFIEACLCLI